MENFGRRTVLSPLKKEDTKKARPLWNVLRLNVYFVKKSFKNDAGYFPVNKDDSLEPTQLL